MSLHKYFDSFEFNKVARDSINTFGNAREYQSLVEECAEYIVAHSHLTKGRHEAQANLVSELADVLIVASILAKVVDTEDLENQIQYKVGKLRRKIELGDVSGNYL